MAIGSPILVTGGTGRLGRIVVQLLRDAGCGVRVLSRRPHDGADGVQYMVGDLLKDEGLQPALEGVPIIVNCAGSAKKDEAQAKSLVRAAARVGRPHLIYVSVVGADRVPTASGLDRVMFGYFGAKLAAERVVAESGLPWTTLRPTQFYQAFETVGRQMAKLPLIPVPAGFRFQPVDTGEVAARLVELALGSPAGLVAEMAGPQVYGMADLLRLYLRAAGKRRLLMSVRVPGRAARAVRSGANLAQDGDLGQRTWEDLLAAQFGRRP